MFSQNSLHQWRQLGLVSFLALVGAIAQGNDFAKAQIVPDNTLGNERSVVTPSPIFDQQINGGARRGANLFHSFEQFNVNVGRRAFFTPDSGIENIISRVTGGSRSEIFGTLGVPRSGVNLFLINPNGIIFGPNAQLNVTGSFVATTANAIQFGDQGFFSASDPNSPPLLVVKPSALLFNQIPKPIINQSRNREAGLQLGANRSLLLVGGNVNLEGGRLLAPGGRIELGGLAGAGTVGLNVDGSNLRLSFPQNVQLADVSLTNGAKVDVSFDRGSSGDIQVQGRRVTLANSSQIVANTLGSQPGGTLTVHASELVELIGGSRLSAETQGAGTGGNLTIETGKLIIRDGSQVAAGAFNSGSGGSVTVRASDSVELSGTSGDGKTVSSILTQTQGAGNAGSVNIETGKLIVQGGARVNTASAKTSSGQGGALVVKASDSVQLIGTSTSAENPEPSGLFALAEGSGKPGYLTIETRQFIARDGARASASNAGSALEGGTLSVTASESVQLIGTSANGQVKSGLLVGTGGTGAAGELTIKTENLQVSDGAFVSARSVGEGRGGGNTNIQVGSLRLDQGSIVSETTSGNGGNITLSVRDLLLLRRGSQISSSAGTEQQPGDGGNITINAPNGTIVAVPGEDSNITANSFSGRGGQIEINTSGLFGIQPSPRFTPENDITAFSERGISGEIAINRPDVEQRLGLVELPTMLADTSILVDTGCNAIASTDADTEKSTFIVTGRGGLPPSPNEPLSTDVIWSDTRLTMLPLHGGEARKLGDRENSTTSPHRPVTSSIPKTHDGVPIVPATGWVFNGKGQVTLISHAPNATGLESTPATCSKR